MAGKYDALLGEYREDDASVVSASPVYLKLDQSINAQLVVGSPEWSFGSTGFIPFFDGRKLTAHTYFKWDSSVYRLTGGPNGNWIQFYNDGMGLNVLGYDRFWAGATYNQSFVPLWCYDSADYPALWLECYGNLKPFIYFSGWESYEPLYNITNYGCLNTSWGTNTAAPDANYWEMSKMLKVLIAGYEYWIPAYRSLYGGGGGSGSVVGS